MTASQPQDTGHASSAQQHQLQALPLQWVSSDLCQLFNWQKFEERKWAGRLQRGEDPVHVITTGSTVSLLPFFSAQFHPSLPLFFPPSPLPHPALIYLLRQAANPWMMQVGRLGPSHQHVLPRLALWLPNDSQHWQNTSPTSWAAHQDWAACFLSFFLESIQTSPSFNPLEIQSFNHGI